MVAAIGEQILGPMDVLLSNWTVRPSRQRGPDVYDPLYGSFVGDQGAWSTTKMYSAAKRGGVAALWGALPGAGLPNQTAAEAQVPRRRGRRRPLATLGEVLLEPARNFFGALQQSSSMCHDPKRFRLEHCAHLHPGAGKTLVFRLPVPAGHGLQPVMYVSAADNDYVGVTGTESGARPWTSWCRQAESRS